MKNCPQCKSFGDIEPISEVQEICDHCKRSNDLDRKRADRIDGYDRDNTGASNDY